LAFGKITYFRPLPSWPSEAEGSKVISDWACDGLVPLGAAMVVALLPKAKKVIAKAATQDLGLGKLKQIKLMAVYSSHVIDFRPARNKTKLGKNLADGQPGVPGSRFLPGVWPLLACFVAGRQWSLGLPRRAQGLSGLQRSGPHQKRHHRRGVFDLLLPLRNL